MKYLKYFLLAFLLFLVIGGIYFYPKYQRGLEIAEALDRNNITHTFLNMDKYFPYLLITPNTFPTFSRWDGIAVCFPIFSQP